MNREKAIIYVVNNFEPDSVFDELKNSFGHERAVNINRELYIKTYEIISKYNDAVCFIAYARTSKFFDLRWMSPDDPGFLNVSGKNYSESFNAVSDFAFKTGARKIVWINHLCPFVTEKEISFAFSEVNDRNIIIGPARNGGIYLVAFTEENFNVVKDIYPLYDGMLDTVSLRARKNRVSVTYLEELYIVKDDESLKHYVASGNSDIKEKKQKK